MSPCREVWGSIEKELYKKQMTKKELARLTGVSPNTISRDARDPGRIPLDRLCLYFTALDMLTGTATGIWQ